MLRLRSPGLPLLSSSVWFSAGNRSWNALTSWRDVTVSTILLLLSQLLQHIKLLSPDKMTSFAVTLKGTPLLKGFQQNGLCLKVSVLHSLWTRSPHWLFSDAAPSLHLKLPNPMQMQGAAKRDYCKTFDLVINCLQPIERLIMNILPNYFYNEQ